MSNNHSIRELEFVLFLFQISKEFRRFKMKMRFCHHGRSIGFCTARIDKKKEDVLHQQYGFNLKAPDSHRCSTYNDEFEW